MAGRVFALFLMTALTVSTAAQAGATSEAPPPSVGAPAPLYLLIYHKGPGWIEGKPMRQQKLGGHLVYMQGLLGDGTLVAGGPFGNVEGGMAILRAADLAEAEAVLAKDPALLNGTFTGSVMQWTPFLDSRQTLVRR